MGECFDFDCCILENFQNCKSLHYAFETIFYGNGLLVHDLHTRSRTVLLGMGSFFMQAASSQATPPDNLNLRPITFSCAAKCSPPCTLAPQLLSRIASISDTSAPLGGGSSAEPFPSLRGSSEIDRAPQQWKR
jgi:hypothetical protein